jgi:hypothetical protein
MAAPTDPGVRGMLGRLADRQHLVLAILAGWLILTSPWVHLFRRIPRDAGLLVYGHIALGLAALGITVTFTVSCARGGGWRRYFPWISGDLGQVGRELRGLRRGELPTAEGGGLFSLIEGALLLAMLATGVTGTAWLVAEGTAAAVEWRGYHVVCARIMIGFVMLHILSVMLHLLDFLRE